MSAQTKKKIASKGKMRYVRPVLVPQWFWTALRSAVKLLPFEETGRLFSHLVPKGSPGSGVLRGRQNISKAVTYRATRVGFNVERDARRAALLLL